MAVKFFNLKVSSLHKFYAHKLFIYYNLKGKV